MECLRSKNRLKRIIKKEVHFQIWHLRINGTVTWIKIYVVIDVWLVKQLFGST